MLNGHKIVVDQQSGVDYVLSPFADQWFWKLDQINFEKNSVYFIGRWEFEKHKSKLKNLITQNYKIILCNPGEGSKMMIELLSDLGVNDLARKKLLPLISGGSMGPEYSFMTYEYFLLAMQNLNRDQISRTEEIFQKQIKPYKFLFFNGRYRPHRSSLIKYFIKTKLIEQSIWSNLDRGNSDFKIIDKKYELPLFRDRIDPILDYDAAKDMMFGQNHWGDGAIYAEPYIDTYFSLVTETVFDYPYSFRTEKIWKPISIGHPWIVASNRGFYRDLRNIGFKTFGHLIDESFDSIDNNEDRLARIISAVEDLCQQNLYHFLTAAKEVCVYNKQHMQEYTVETRKNFPGRFKRFMEGYLS